MNKYLIKLANHLDKKGFHKEADYVDWILKKTIAAVSLEKKSEVPDDIKEKIWNYMIEEEAVPESVKDLKFSDLKILQFPELFWEVKEGEFGYEKAKELSWTDGDKYYYGEI